MIQIHLFDKRLIAVCLAFSFLLGGLAAAEQSQSVSQGIVSSFALKGTEAIVSSLESLSKKQTVPADKKEVLAVLADYEERLGLLASASGHFYEAALADPVLRDDSLILESARCALGSNDTEKANGLVQSVLLTSLDEKTLLRARVYSAWVLLSAGERSSALPLFRLYAQNAAYAEFIPSLLFTLWWSDADKDARSRLLKDFSASPEAAIVRGDFSLSPSPFWYLMGKNDGLVSAFAKEGTGAVSAPPVTVVAPQNQVVVKPLQSESAQTASSGKVWQQVGFFRNKEYADELVAQLQKKGFKPIIRSEKRPSGTVYLSVLVSEDAQRSVGLLLKDAGYESFLIIDQ